MIRIQLKSIGSYSDNKFCYLKLRITNFYVYTEEIKHSENIRMKEFHLKYTFI